MSHMLTITTNDNKQYLIQQPLLRRYSTFFNLLLQSCPPSPNPQPFHLPSIHSSSFDFIYEFLQIHKHTPPQLLPRTIIQKQPLINIMSSQDVQLIERIKQQKNQNIKNLFNATYFLGIDQFKKYLISGIIRDYLGYRRNINKKCNSQDVQKDIKEQIQIKIKSVIQLEKIKKNQ